MKQCKKCEKSKSINEFEVNKKMHDGHLNVCKLCNKPLKKKLAQRRNARLKERYGISIRAINHYGVNLALLVYDRAKRQCEKCGRKDNLTIHHKDRKGRNLWNKGLKENNNPDNLMILCRKCHGSIHGKQNDKKKVFINFDGKKQSISEWERELGFSEGVLQKRLMLGWSLKRVFIQPQKRKGIKVKYGSYAGIEKN